MCGLCGIFSSQGGLANPGISDSIRKMTAMMARRGPDDEGFWQDPDGRLQLGFRRLSILDRSSAGHQPMVSENKSAVIVFNGEIYNFLEIRNYLEKKGYHFHSRSDTEVLLNALDHWREDALNKINGMFGFAWYSLKEKLLLLARDHAGIKPLYYTIHPSSGRLAFASQYNVLLQAPWKLHTDFRPDVLKLFLKLQHIPPPYGILANTYQLEPGHYLKARFNSDIQKKPWWSLPRENSGASKSKEITEAFISRFSETINRQRIADVPLGVYLSGGIDSPLVAATARQQMGPGLKVFTISNPDWDQDETEDAIEYNRHIGAQHLIYNITGDITLKLIEDVIQAQHEPFADFSIIPSLLINQFAKKEVTVALGGDGADELFFGYQRPFSLLKNGTDFAWPWLIRIALYAAGKYGLIPRRSSVIVSRNPGEYYFNVNCRMGESDLSKIAPELKGIPEDFLLYHFEKYKGKTDLALYSRYVEYYGQMQRCLKKVDMASMFHSLELRVPFLDKTIVEFAAQLQPFSCMENGRNKSIIRHSLARHIPQKSITKGKRGFAVPLGEWLRHSLRDVVESTLFDKSSPLPDIFNLQGLKAFWQQHLSGERDLKWEIWTLLSFSWWYRHHLKNHS